MNNFLVPFHITFVIKLSPTNIASVSHSAMYSSFMPLHVALVIESFLTDIAFVWRCTIMNGSFVTDHVTFLVECFTANLARE